MLTHYHAVEYSSYYYQRLSMKGKKMKERKNERDSVYRLLINKLKKKKNIDQRVFKNRSMNPDTQFEQNIVAICQLQVI